MNEKIMDIFERVLPVMSRDDRNILIGFALAQDRKHPKAEDKDEKTS